MLAVVVADVAVEGEYDFERRQFGGSPDQLRLLTEWLIEQKVQEVVMESTARYWRPVWQTLERSRATHRLSKRLWRTVVRRKYQLTCDRVRLQNQLEALLEEAHLKWSKSGLGFAGLPVHDVC
jgi:hypothetical protein